MPTWTASRWCAAALAALAATCAVRGTGSARVQATMYSTMYYVSPSGTDANPGTLHRPFRTIQQAADIASPGDTVIVADGVYSATDLEPPCGDNGARPVVCLRRGGTAQAWITFRAQTRWRARINGRTNATSTGFRFLTAANYIHIEGFDIFGMGSAVQSAAGLELYGGGHDVVIAQNQIHHVGRLCTDVSNGQVGVFVQQPRVTITQNVIYDIGRFAAGENACSPKTTYYQNHDHGIYVDGRTVPGASDTVVTNNIFYNIQRGWPIQVYPGTVTGLSILSNTFAFENPYSAGHILIGASVRNGQIINNIFYEPHSVAINFYAGTHTNLRIANNLSSRAMAARAPDGVTLANNLEHADPRVSPPDFTPASDSPAIDAGLSLSDVRVDINGVGRPQGRAWDIGATERASPPRFDKQRRSGLGPIAPWAPSKRARQP
jgi:hypothetical protein